MLQGKKGGRGKMYEEMAREFQFPSYVAVGTVEDQASSVSMLIKSADANDMLESHTD